MDGQVVKTADPIAADLNETCMTHTGSRLGGQNGALLISIVAAMTVIATLGAVMVYLTSGSTEQELITNVRNRAYYLAESGFRYATTRRDPSLAENPSLFTNSRFTMGVNERFELTTYENPLDSTRVIIVSTGVVNQGVEPEGATHRITYNVSKDNLSGDEIVGEELTDTTSSTADDGFSDLSGWHSNDLFTIEEFVSGTGTHIEYAATADTPSSRPDPDNPGEKYRETTLRLDNNTEFADQWAGNHSFLSYDVQVKMGWGYELEYGAQGISFRLNESSINGKYQFYAISFMKYRREDSSTDDTKDYIPDSIKPLRSDGRHLRDRILIVLWEQKVVSGQETRRWLAYKDVTDDACVAGNQWTYDGQCMTDNSSLLVRVHEKEVAGTRVQDVKIFYGDASNPDNCAEGDDCSECNSRNPNGIAYDIRALRNYYWPSYEYSGISPYPAFPPLEIPDWTAADDYYSFIETSPDSYTVTQTRWDRVVSGITVLSDGGTLRLTEFTTPDGVSTGETTFPPNRDEIGLHAIGQVSGGNSSMSFDDFALQYLNTDGSTSKGFVQQ